MSVLKAEEELDLMANPDAIPLLQSKYPQDPSRVSGRIDFDEWVWHKLQTPIVLQEELDDYMFKWNDPSVALSGSGWCDRDLVNAYENNKKFRIILARIITFLIRGEDLSGE